MTIISKRDLLLLKYASGSLSGHKKVMASTLLLVSGKARLRLSEFESIGGQILEGENPAEISVECLEIVLKKID